MRVRVRITVMCDRNTIEGSDAAFQWAVGLTPDEAGRETGVKPKPKP